MNGVANSRLRRRLARNKSLECADVRTGGSVISYKSGGRKSAPKWRSPAAIPGVDETGVTGKAHDPMFGVARYCFRKRDGPKDVGSVDWDSASGLDMETGMWPS